MYYGCPCLIYRFGYVLYNNYIKIKKVSCEFKFPKKEMQT